MTQDNPDQPDGIDSDSLDLPDPHNAARRVRDFLEAYGDGEVETVWSEGYLARPGVEQRPLYARDLEALSRLPELLAAQRERAARLEDELHGEALSREGMLRDLEQFIDEQQQIGSAIAAVADGDASLPERVESLVDRYHDARDEVARLRAQSDTGDYPGSQEIAGQETLRDPVKKDCAYCPYPAEQEYEVGQRVEWNPREDVWEPAVVAAVGDLVQIRLDCTGQHMTVERYHLRPVSSPADDTEEADRG